MGRVGGNPVPLFDSNAGARVCVMELGGAQARAERGISVSRVCVRGGVGVRCGGPHAQVPVLCARACVRARYAPPPNFARKLVPTHLDDSAFPLTARAAGGKACTDFADGRRISRSLRISKRYTISTRQRRGSAAAKCAKKIISGMGIISFRENGAPLGGGRGRPRDDRPRKKAR